MALDKKRVARVVLATGVILVLTILMTCSHPLEIVGEGDIVDLNDSGHGCTLEQFVAKDKACSENLVIDAYDVNYRAIPRPGWRFDRWDGPCGPESAPPDCRIDVSVEWVWWAITHFPGLAMPPTVAVFEGPDDDGDGSNQPADCDDSDETVHPGATDIDGDGMDQDCNGIELSGDPEVVFNWSSDACEDLDIPDLPPRAFRDRNGQVQLIAGELKSIGPDLDNQTHLCGGVIPSDWDADPAKFNDDEMVGATYTEDGETVYALVSNEYHGWDHPGQCTASDSFLCWYNGITLAVSTDGGSSFHHPVTPPDHLVASYPRRYVVNSGPYGAFVPSSIVKGADAAYYAFFQLIPPELGYAWACVMRSDDLADPDSWRFWDGEGYNGRFVNPYTDSFENVDEHVCKSIDFDAISDMHSSLTYNEYLDRYMLLHASSVGNTEGFYYSLSEDLINWTPRQLIFEGPPPGSEINPSETGYLYASFLDPDSTSRSFDTVGKTAYIYYSQFNGGAGSDDRDLMRIPVEFFRY